MDRKILVMPQFNEAKTVIQVLDEACDYADAIVVVDDGSTDGSYDLVERWMQDRDKVYLIRLAKNRGMSGALLAGFCLVCSFLDDGTLDPDDIVINIDADGQHSPAEIPGAVEYLREHGYDVVLARRDLSGYPRFKRLGNWGLSFWASLLGGVKYHDVECGFRAMRAAVIPHLLKYFTGRRYGCAQEIGVIAALLGFRISNELPTHINYYRPGARVRDGLVNVVMGLLAFLRVKLGLANDLYALTRKVSTDALTLEPAAALDLRSGLVAPPRHAPGT